MSSKDFNKDEKKERLVSREMMWGKEYSKRNENYK